MAYWCDILVLIDKYRIMLGKLDKQIESYVRQIYTYINILYDRLTLGYVECRLIV